MADDIDGNKDDHRQYLTDHPLSSNTFPMKKQTASTMFHVMNRHDRTGIIALFVGLSHLALLLVIQLEDYLLYLWPTTHSIAALVFFVAGLGFAQWENIIVAVLLAALTLITTPSRPGRWLSFSIVSLANLYLVLDQVGFKLFFDHFHPSMLEGTQRLGELWSSITAELDGAFFFNVLLLFLISGALFYIFFHESALQRFHWAARWGGLHRSSKALVVVCLLIVVGALFPVQANYVKLYHHPFHNILAALRGPPHVKASPTMASTASAAAAEPRMAGPGKPLDIQNLRFGKISPVPQSDERLDAALQASQAQNTHWNVIWIIMESVGSKQLLTADGRPDPAITPTLAQLAEHGALFDSLYSVFPGTVRSHVDMVTGGRTLTWGSVFKELTYPYQGPTIARAFSAAGYDTALFSAQKLDFENMNGFYKQAGYTHYYDFGEADPEFQKQNTLQSWGAKEGSVLSLAVKWLDQRRDHSRPFFLQYLTVATHHPYDVPGDFRGPVLGTTRESNYQNALNYTDSALSILLKQLQSRHLLDNTLIVINGDHGEAFGGNHAQNFLHKNYIYDENVRNFLLIANPKLFPDTVLSRRVASIGDIMPTVLAMANLPPADVPGQNLMAKAFKPRLVYFYKNTDPEQWGLRDGQWKYIGGKLGNSEELYDLSFDPNEVNNLAEIYPDRVALYDKLAGRWYAETNHEFVSRLKNFQYPGGKELSDADLRTAGPKLLTFGYKQPAEDGSDGEFAEAKSFNPFEQVVAWTHWIHYPRDKTIQYVWQSPNGDARNVDFTVKSKWSITLVNNSAPLPMAEGTWHVSLKDGDNTLISGSFTVDRNAPLHIARAGDAQAKEIAVGKYVITDLGKEDLTKTAKIKPGDRIAVWTRWKRLNHDRRIVYRWKAPSGQITEFYFDVKKGWDQTYVNLGNDKPLESGRWEVTLWDGERKLTSATFDVAAGSP